MKRNLVLIGYRGTGKSTVAALVAQRLGWPAVTLDAQIAGRAGLSIPQIVERFGWPHFRALEHAEVLRAAALERHVLDCGGGVVEDARNVEALRANGFCVLLTAQVATIAARIGGDANRPSLTGKSVVDEIQEKLAQRGPLYQAAADVVLATDDESPRATAERILAAARAPLALD